MIHRLIIKILVTSIAVVAISETAKRSVWLGAILAAFAPHLASRLGLTLDRYPRWGKGRRVFDGGLLGRAPDACILLHSCLSSTLGVAFPCLGARAAALTVGVYYLYYLGLKQLGIQL